MPKFSMTITMRAGVDEVFDICTDLRSAPERISGITKMEVLTDGPIRAGTRFRETRVMFKKEHTEEMEVTGFTPGKSYTVTSESCGCIYKSGFDFAPVEDGTNVTFRMDARPFSIFAKIMTPLTSLMFGPMMRKCVGQDLADIKAFVEGKTSRDTPAVAGA